MKNPDWRQNLLIDGYFSDFESGNASMSIKQTELITKIHAEFPQPLPPSPPISVPAWWNPDKPLQDGSPTLPNNLGRFCDGIVRIGDPSVEICNNSTGSCIVNHDPNVIKFSTSIDLTTGGNLKVVLSKTSIPNTQPFTIIDIQKNGGSDFVITLESPADLYAYNNGDARVAGGKKCTACVVASNGVSDQITIKNTNGKSNLFIPITIMDDDEIPWGGTSNIIQPLTFSATKEIFKEGYIDVAIDGGGRLSNNKDNIPFSWNINDLDKSDKYAQESFDYYYKYDMYPQSKNYEKSSYWVAYVISAWQSTTLNDNDPLGEKAIAGITKYSALGNVDCDVTIGGDISAIFHETIKDFGYNDYIEKICAHEIGHQFGLSHGKGPNDKKDCALCVTSNCPDQMGLMNLSLPYSPSYKFIPYHINIIRSRYKSPGR